MRLATRLCGALAALAFAASAQAQVVEREVPEGPVAIDSGRLAGKVLDSGVRAWFGVPFAAPPVRELRWRAPAPVKPWAGVFNADRFAPECPQGLRAHNINHYFGEEATSEDCLYLNIWAPPQKAEKLPVMVWIYGGGFSGGSASMANYAGESLARKGVVYVSLAYRLGALGFMAHPALSAEQGHSGDYGLMDQVAALQWIQRNIARFGGDPGNVTIMGQSAGAMSVSDLQASPMGKGLFHRAVGMSGSQLAPSGFGSVGDRAQGEASGLALQKALGVGSLAEMRDLPSDRILQAARQLPGQAFAPIVDGHVLPDQPAALFAKGQQNDVPILIGFTHDEVFSAIGRPRTLADYQAEAARSYGDQAQAFLKLYPAKTEAQVRAVATEAGRDSSVGLAQWSWARGQGSGKAPAYVFLFSRVHPYAPGITFADHDPASVGAYHTGDVPYWLQTQDALNIFRQTRVWTPYDRQLAEQMSNALVTFARTGDPSGGGLAWPRYEPRGEKLVEFGDSVAVRAWPNRDRLGFFAAHPAQSGAPAAPPANRARD